MDERDVSPRDLLASLRRERTPAEEQRVEAALRESAELRGQLRELMDALVEMSLYETSGSATAPPNIPPTESNPMSSHQSSVPGTAPASSMHSMVFGLVSLAALVLLGALFTWPPFGGSPPAVQPGDLVALPEAVMPMATFEETHGLAITNALFRPAAGKPTDAAPPVELERPVTDEEAIRYEVTDEVESDDAVVDDGYIITTFSHLGKQRSVYLTKKFIRIHGGVPPTNASFREFMFYVKPDVILSQNELEASLETALKEPQGKNVDGPVYRLPFTVRLITKELREAAAKAINHNYPEANVAADNIALVTPRGLQLFVRSGENVIPFETRRNTGSLLEQHEMALVATEPVLKAFVNDGEVFAKYRLRGFRMKQNSVGGVLHFMMAAKLHHRLTGQAGYDAHREWKAEGSTGTLRLPFLGAQTTAASGYQNATFDSWVTRNQVRDVVETAVQSAAVSVWIEAPERERADLVGKVMDQLLSFAKKETIPFKKVEGDTTGNGAYVADTSADALGELKLDVTVTPKSEADIKKEATLSKDSAKASDHQHYIDQNNIVWQSSVAGDGTKIFIPKSIDVFQFNNAKLSETFRLVTTETTAVYIERPGAFETAVCVKNIPPVVQTFHAKGRISQPGVFPRIAGDGDVDMEDGHPTYYALTVTAAPRVGVVPTEAAEAFATISVRYWVKEGEPDHTEFLDRRDHTVPLDPRSFGKPIVAFGPFENVDVSSHRQEANDRLNHAVFGVANTANFKDVRMKLDGDGDEDRESGNQGYWFEADLPYRVEMEPARRERRLRHGAQAKWDEYNG